MPYPRHPLRGCSCLSCTNRANRAYLPTEFTEFTEASGRGYSPTDFTDAHRFLGCVFAPNLCTSVQSVGVFLGGYGIPAISTPPSKGVHLSQVHQPSKPRISSHRIHRIHGNFWQRIFSHGFHRCSQIRRVWHPAIPTPPSEVLPQNSRISQKRLVRNILPRISQMPTDG